MADFHYNWFHCLIHWFNMLPQKMSISLLARGVSGIPLGNLLTSLHKWVKLRNSSLCGWSWGIIFALACEKNCMEFSIIPSHELSSPREKMIVGCKVLCPGFNNSSLKWDHTGFVQMNQHLNLTPREEENCRRCLSCAQEQKKKMEPNPEVSPLLLLVASSSSRWWDLSLGCQSKDPGWSLQTHLPRATLY